MSQFVAQPFYPAPFAPKPNAVYPTEPGPGAGALFEYIAKARTEHGASINSERLYAL